VRVLFASLGAPGLLFPLLGLADRLRQAGTRTAFVTDVAFTTAVENAGQNRIPRSDPDGPSFQIDDWRNPVRIAIQARHLEYAIAAFHPDVLVTSNLALGPLIAGETHGIPVAVLGSPVLLYKPFEEPANPHQERLSWRYHEYREALRRARAALGLPPRTDPYQRDPIFGDALLLQGVAELDLESAALPDRARYVGSCVSDICERAIDPAVVAWTARQRAQGRPLLYVQLGRVFDHPSCWPAIARWLEARDAAAIVDADRYDGPELIPEARVLLCGNAVQSSLLPHVDAVASSGHPTSVLGAIAQGLPLAIAYTGSGTEDIAEACVAYGCAAAANANTASAEDVFAALDVALHDPARRAAARRLRACFAVHDGSAEACAAIDELARPRLAVGAR
jgi:UDP:flavonoid glycosyltransferase YjiC (YdhE family)